VLGFWPWYQDWRTSKEIKRTKRLSALMVVRYSNWEKKNILPRIYCRGSPRDLRDTICSKDRSGWTAFCIHLSSRDAWLFPKDEDKMVNKRESMQGKIR
jgi:hypothetical protein